MKRKEKKTKKRGGMDMSGLEDQPKFRSGNFHGPDGVPVQGDFGWMQGLAIKDIKLLNEDPQAKVRRDMGMPLDLSQIEKRGRDEKTKAKTRKYKLKMPTPVATLSPSVSNPDSPSHNTKKRKRLDKEKAALKRKSKKGKLKKERSHD